MTEANKHWRKPCKLSTKGLWCVAQNWGYGDVTRPNKIAAGLSYTRSRAQTREDMEAQAALYSAWAWGDVYGYVVERDGEEIDSCWSFYGSDPEKSGLSEQAIGAIEWDIKARRKSHFDKLKRLIKARAPLEVREPLCA